MSRAAISRATNEANPERAVRVSRPPANGKDVIATIAPDTAAPGRGKRKAAARQAKAPPIAARMDRHRLYELSVQSVDAEIDFVDETYFDLRGRRAKVLREDFCGTANTSCEWVRRRPSNIAIGVDLDPEVLAWGRGNRVSKLKPAARSRVNLVQHDVMTVKTEPLDVVLAMNFSYWLFMSRERLRDYFCSVREHLAPGGVFFLDCYGGYESCQEIRDKREIKARGPWGKGFTYIWDQSWFDPISSQMVCHIHFKFEDGSKLNRAFSYRWRLWTLPEIREVLAEAGFARSTVYWEGWDEDENEGDGDFQPADVGEADPAWICYVVAEK